MAASVICISHAQGAAGQEIGKLVAERAGFRYVDEGIIGAAARADGLFPEAVSLAETRGAKRQLEVDFNRFERTDKLRQLIRDAIHATAGEGNVVIVAHAASFALAGQGGALRVLITASDDTRTQRIAEANGYDAKAAGKELKDSDKGRAAYLKHFYDVAHEQPTHYDLVLNTDQLPLPAAVAAIVAAATADAAA
jgi:cytidylate kinase